MINRLQPYRYFFLAMLLLVYGQSILQPLLLEIAHTLGHLSGYAQNDFQKHTLHSHDGSHYHSHLELMVSSSDKSPEETPSPIDAPTKKVQICNTPLLINQLIPPFLSSAFPFWDRHWRTVLRRVLTPPPDQFFV